MIASRQQLGRISSSDVTRLHGRISCEVVRAPDVFQANYRHQRADHLSFSQFEICDIFSVIKYISKVRFILKLMNCYCNPRNRLCELAMRTSCQGCCLIVCLFLFKHLLLHIYNQTFMITLSTCIF